MSATDELRRMLDEHDEYYKTSGNKTWWGRPIDRQTGKPINVFHYQAQPMGEDRLFVELQLATPAQAIAATIGDTDATPTRQGDADLAAENAKLRELLAIASDMARDYDGDRRLLRELVRDYHRFADAMCAERDCDGCSQRDEGACERGVLTSRECVLGVAE